MPRFAKFFSLLLITAVFMHPALSETGVGEDGIVSHALDVSIDPDQGSLRATDTLTLPASKRQVMFWLHEGLQPEVISGNAVLERIGHEEHLERFRLTPKNQEPVTISYGGRIRHDMRRVREGMGRSREQSVGTIDRDGVFLSGYTGWYPSLPDSLLRFTLDVELPPNWLAVSQGAGPEIQDTGRAVRIGWREDQPQDEIQLSAARFKLYRRDTPFGEAQAYLRLPDDALAARYLDATADYLARYSELIGNYPYAKFALVENFWETGYGMPSFTLLGSQVLRLPFILHSSYPHEILHNWWGNGVYVDYQAGNWSEGLTAYLADHLNQEIAGRGADYRRDQLKAYADYVLDGEDFPLTAFRGRHGSASQAIGYGKMLMTMHMLRVLLGDDDFRRGLQRFYADNQFRSADFDDLRGAFETVSERDLQPFFDAWTSRTGAPELTLSQVAMTREPDGGYRVSGSVDQAQTEAPFAMAVPIVIHAEQGEPRELLVKFDGRSARFEALLPAAPVRIAVDPGFDTFRRLLPEESPVALSNLFGAETGLMLLPTDA
ncbi:MAG: M1 family aminopeptidase, partial [Thiohalocapsa sp.]